MRLDDGSTSRGRAVSLLAGGGWLATLIYTAQSILLVPMYLEFLGSRLYGLWLASGGVLVWLAMMDFGVSALTTQRCGAAYGRGDLAAAASYFRHGAAITLGLMVVLLALGLLASAWVPAMFRADPRYVEPLRQAFWIATLTAVVAVALEFVKGFAAAFQRVGALVVAGIVGDLLAIAVTVGGLLAGWGLIALALGGLVRFLVPAVVGVPHALALCRATGHRPRWSSGVFGDYRRSAPSLLSARSTGQVALGLPAVLIGRFIGPEATVAYSVSVRAVQVSEMLFNQALVASSGAISHLHGGADRRAFLHGLGRWALVVAALVVFPLAMCAGANSGFVTLWVGAEHYAGQSFTLLAVVAGLAATALRGLQHLSFNLGATDASARLWTTEHVARALLLVLLVPTAGVHGAPLATLLAALVVAPAVAALARRSIGEWPAAGRRRLIERAAALMALVALASVVSPWLVRATWWQWLAGTVVLGLVLAAALSLVLPALRGEAMTLLCARRRPPAGTGA